ncbi:epoxide hydrolase [Fusarium heterosporum]|uniref:Epoxide hydrolase n=1 Tax=Fusarium heterosporum TaxID=42747 RepID=A0A8H5SLC9_FUSHE|nr:epoxide hydrolase [Fusarium heterosporum]
MPDCHKLVPEDPRVTTITSTIRGKSYQYLRACPQATPSLTVFLIHGFSDLSFGWRHQIPYLIALGYQVIAPDLLGCGGSARPDDLHCYTFRSVASDIQELARSIVGEEKIVLGGHGLGGAVVWRTAMWYPELVLGIFSISTPFLPPSTVFLTPDDPVLEFGMKPLSSPADVQKKYNDAQSLCRTSQISLPGVEPCGKINTACGVRLLFRNLVKYRQSGTLTRRESLVYTRQYLTNGRSRVEEALRWFHFQTRTYNLDDEVQFVLEPTQFTVPALYIAVDEEEKVVIDMRRGMSRHFQNLCCTRISGSRPCLWESAMDVNRQIGEWMAFLPAA